MKRIDSKLKFVNLHGHSSVGSPYDGLGEPGDFLEFAYENGMDAIALTDHGNMNGLSYQVLHAKKMEKEGRKIKPLYGCEFYYIDDVIDWREEYNKASEDKKRKKQLEKKQKGVVFEEENREQITDKVTGNAHFLVIAQNEVGLRNLFYLVSKSHDTREDYFFRKPRIDCQLLKENSEGLIATTTCISGVFAKLVWMNPEATQEELLKMMQPYLQKFIDIFGKDRFFGELQWNAIKEQHVLNQCIIELCKRNGLKLISTVDYHYARPELWRARETYKRLGFLGRDKKPEWISKEIPETIDGMDYELYPKNGDQMFEDYRKYSERMGFKYDDDVIIRSIENTHRIAHNMVESFYPNTDIKLPTFVVPDGVDANEMLREKCFVKLEEKGFGQKYKERLEEELEVLKNNNFAEYFLTKDRIVQEIRKTQLMGGGRGSAAGSLIAYLLDITEIDPLKWGTMFSRFLRSDSDSMPDIDVDCEEPARIKEHLVEEWGQERVALISNMTTLQLKSIVKDVSRLHEIPFSEVNPVTGKMIREATTKAKKKHGIKAGVYVPTWEEVLEYSDSLKKFLKKYPHVQTYIKSLIGQKKASSVHAGGLLVSENLFETMPLIRSKGKMQTPWCEGQNVRHLEPFGFIKFDILGIASLRMIRDCISHILRRHYDIENPTFEDVKHFYDEFLHPDVIDHNDQRVYEHVYHKGNFAGTFQFTESGVQKFSQQVKPISIMEGSAVTSTYRPGPMDGNVPDMYLEGKYKEYKRKYYNDIHKKITEDTYSFLIFQEQISSLVSGLSKYLSEEDGHTIRKLFTKKEKGGARIDTSSITDPFIKQLLQRDLGLETAKKLKEYYERFEKGCLENNMKIDEIRELWENIAAFAGYGFSKNHAIPYFFLSFQCAWLYTYYPVEWVAAFLDKEPEDKKEQAINVAKRANMDIEDVDINLSNMFWDIIDEKTVIQPLTGIKGLGEKAVQEILSHRPFYTIEDLLFNERISYRRLNKRSLDVLTRSGTLNCLMDARFEHMRHFWLSVVDNRPGNQEELLENIEKFKYEDDFTTQQKIDFKVELSGLFPFSTVITKDVEKRLLKSNIPSLTHYDNEHGVVWCIAREVTPRKTAKGKTYWIVNCIDSYGGQEDVKIWGIHPSDTLDLNRPLMIYLEYCPKWGYSTRTLRSNMKYLDE